MILDIRENDVKITLTKVEGENLSKMLELQCETININQIGISEFSKSVIKKSKDGIHRSSKIIFNII